MIPLVLGIGLLFFNGRSIAGWLLDLAGAVIIFVGILTHLDIYFQPTSLFNTLLMLALLAGGIGSSARSLRATCTRTGVSWAGGAASDASLTRQPFDFFAGDLNGFVRPGCPTGASPGMKFACPGLPCLLFWRGLDGCSGCCDCP